MTQRMERTSVAIVFMGLAVLAVAVAPRLFVLFDEAYNLNISQNLADRGLYASRLGEWYRPFDPEVTTGPTLLIPVAAALRVGGPTFVVVRAAMVIVFLICMALAFLAARELLAGTLPALAFMLIFASTSLVLEFGLCVLGDIPAIALALAGFGLMHRAERTPRRAVVLLIASGCAFGLSVLAKDIMLLLVLGIALAWASDLRRAETPLRRSWHWLVPVAVTALFTLGWRAYQFAAMSAQPDAEARAIWQKLSTETAARIWATVSFAPFSHVASAWADSVGYFLPLLLCLAIAGGGALLVRRAQPDMQAPPASRAHMALAASCALWLIWYYALSGPQATHRHLLPAVILGEMLIVGVVVRLRAAARQDRSVRIAGALLAACLCWSLLHGVGVLRLYLESSERRLAMQQQAAAWIKDNTPQQAVLSGWGWYVPWHVGFLAQRTVSRVDPSTPDLQGVTEWFVLSPEVEWGGGMDDELRAFLARQGPPALAQRLYPVYRVTVFRAIAQPSR